MYLFTYAFSDEDTNELYAEYHLSRQVSSPDNWRMMMGINVKPHILYKALRICKKGTKYCGWHREMPDFKQWRSACLVRQCTLGN